MNRLHLLALACFCVVPMAALAETTGSAGSANPSPVSSLQPSVAITYAIRTQGIYPSTGGSPVSTLGEVAMFAGNFAPGGYLPADGRTLAISSYSTLYSVLGTTYGGNGTTTFALPDLRGRVAVGAGQGAGLTNRTVGQSFGSESLTLTAANLPAHTHTLSSISATTSSTGAGQAYTRLQPSLAINYIVPTTGLYPSRDGSTADTGSDATLGFVYGYAGSHLPNGWLTASGQTLPIQQYAAMFSLLGATYGGNGSTTFALPDLRGRAPIGVGSTHAPGLRSGSETVTLTTSQIPAHIHSTSIGATTPVGGNAPISNAQPTLALHYVIATDGICPQPDWDAGDEPLFGQISLFAGNFAPSGWAFCDGQTLPISQYSTLFGILGNTYGGNGTSTFALPNLDNYVAVGTGQGPGLPNWYLGETGGSSSVTLSSAQLPAHTHEVAVPEPSCLALLLLGVSGLASRRRHA